METVIVDAASPDPEVYSHSATTIEEYHRPPTPIMQSTGQRDLVPAPTTGLPDVQTIRVLPDHHSCFGEYIASESRLLPANESDELRERIIRTMFEYKAELRRRTDASTIEDLDPIE